MKKLTKKAPERSLTEYLKKNRRPQQPRARSPSVISGGGNKVKYRIIDFKRNKDGIPAKVADDRIRSEPFRHSSRCFTMPTAKSATSWLLYGLKVGDTVVSGETGRHQARQLRWPWRTSPSAR